jgi:hypothetical protein
VRPQIPFDQSFFVFHCKAFGFPLVIGMGIPFGRQHPSVMGKTDIKQITIFFAFALHQAETFPPLWLCVLNVDHPQCLDDVWVTACYEVFHCTDIPLLLLFYLGNCPCQSHHAVPPSSFLKCLIKTPILNSGLRFTYVQGSSFDRASFLMVNSLMPRIGDNSFALISAEPFLSFMAFLLGIFPPPKRHGYFFVLATPFFAFAISMSKLNNCERLASSHPEANLSIFLMNVPRSIFTAFTGPRLTHTCFWQKPASYIRALNLRCVSVLVNANISSLLVIIYNNYILLSTVFCLFFIVLFLGQSPVSLSKIAKKRVFLLFFKEND